MEQTETKQAKAILLRASMSAQKVRLTADLIRGKKTTDALNILNNKNNKASGLIDKVLKSAIANAKNNLELDEDKLYVKEILINDGPVLKRAHPGSRGHMDRRDKRSCHINIIVGEKN